MTVIRSILVAVAAAATLGGLVGCAPASGTAAPDASKDATDDLWAAIAAEDADAAIRAIEDGANLEDRGGENDATPLIQVTKQNQPLLARVLIDAGADVNAKDSMQDSAFLYAGAEGLDEILTLTIEAGADVTSTNRYGGTALIPASEHGHVSTVKMLIAAGVPVDHVNKLGWTAMHEAIILNDGGPDQVETVRLLLEAGADPDITENDGLTSRELAVQKGYDEIVAVIDAAAGE
ncbi:ankyrin repeat domain-containing protein [Microbacterium sp. NPDC089321]|uniref:ankyrin repeat domain-containing protein n=1 Tax=Microbacterium sp. NPDC089321 TaxID=3155183 RepID=UPI0034276DAC